MVSTKTATLTLVDGMAFRGETGDGQTLTLDSTLAGGGQGRGPTPMDLLLLGLGGCTGMDVISILRKMRQQVSDYQIRVTGERAETHPMVYTSLTVEHVVTGTDLDPASVRRAIELSETHYCSVAAMLRQAAPIALRYRLIDAATGVETSADLEPAQASPSGD
jgi:putative redox protein